MSEKLNKTLKPAVLPLTPPLQFPTTPPHLADLGGPGFEFRYSLTLGLKDKVDQQRGRQERYARFGADEEDLRLTTPSPLREAYRKLVEDDLNDTHTPSPSPTPSTRSIHDSDLLAATDMPVSSKSRARGCTGATGHARNPVQGKGKQQLARARSGRLPAPTKITKRNRAHNKHRSAQRRSTHPMTTRSKAQGCEMHRLEP
ncbi:hypothetical protein ACEPPN_006515 [Leptodophora sp. 'Broadleaf-Isolate-01']